jgi:anti-sigma regulatory factor (Ser/Thr protein kinase)
VPAPVTRSFRAHPTALYEVRQFVRTLSEGDRLSEQMTGDLLVAVSEACANSILHTNTREVRVTWKSTDACVELEVVDEGIFKRRVRMPELEGAGGHGIALMMALVDELSIREGTPASPGTLVRLVKCRAE